MNVLKHSIQLIIFLGFFLSSATSAFAQDEEDKPKRRLDRAPALESFSPIEDPSQPSDYTDDSEDPEKFDQEKKITDRKDKRSDKRKKD